MRKKKTYRQWWNSSPLDNKYDVYYEYLSEVLALFFVGVMIIVPFIGIFLLISIVGLLNFIGNALLFILIIMMAGMVLFLIYSIIMVIKSEIEKYKKYREYAKEIDIKNEELKENV